MAVGVIYETWRGCKARRLAQREGSTGQGRATLYRAQREHDTSRCGGVIREGGIFTKEAKPASVLLLVRFAAAVPRSLDRVLVTNEFYASDSQEAHRA